MEGNRVRSRRAPIYGVALLFLGGCAESPAPVAKPTSSSTPAQTARECTVDADCVVVPRSCCGACGSATREDHIVLHKDDVATYARMVCASQACPGCVAQIDAGVHAVCAYHACLE
ncbi:hypothetical protein BH09MYX1_BH09MYX1_03180 [soil metagenome]